ncbi:MAG TPA: ribonuclease HII [Gammaproteobacteria bacterium]|nr:ribonuclease HII [Gammaproteobacteria bacterium]
MYDKSREYPLLTAGVDEVGRGPLAGPVVAAAVILDPEKPIEGLADSKKLSEKKREYLYPLIRECAICYCVAEASVEEIDEINILQASLLAMRRAIEGLEITPEFVLVDGNKPPDIPIPLETIIKGDSLIASISAASILAKVERDRMMVEYHKQYPEFSFHKHKAYGSRQHMAELAMYGPLAVHRKTFAPVRKLLTGK